MHARKIGSAPAGRNGVGEPHTEGPMTTRLRGLLALGVCLCLTLALLPAPARAAATGNWTDNGNYDTAWYVGHENETEFTLTTAAELAGLITLTRDGRLSFSGKTVRLGADIDLSAHLWTPVEGWSGTFDGAGKTISGNNAVLFEAVASSGIIHSLRLEALGVSLQGGKGNSSTDGILVRKNAGTIYDCAVSGSIQITGESGSDSFVYAGGLAGDNSGTIKNCSARITSLTASLTYGENAALLQVGGIAGTGAGTVENCFANVDNATIAPGSAATEVQYRLAPAASYSYWDAATKLTDSAAATAPAYTQCYAVTAVQIAGTGADLISSTPTDSYAKTPSLVTALNNWVGAQTAGSYSMWSLNRQGQVMPSVLLPTYIDIDRPLNDVNHQNAAGGDIETGMSLEGQMQRNLTLLSVTLPASIPFIVDMEANGAFKRVLSATGSLTNLSDCGVNITLTAVADGGGLLDKVNLFLIPDPAPAGGNVALAAGTGKTDLLAALAAPAAGSATTATVKVDGTDKLSGASLGDDGAQFTVDLTLKVSKQ